MKQYVAFLCGLLWILSVLNMSGCGPSKPAIGDDGSAPPIDDSSRTEKKTCEKAKITELSPKKIITTNQRIALVIGNGGYTRGSGFSELPTPVNDARDMSDKLRNVGFSVICVIEADKAMMETAIQKFKNRLGRDVEGIFYYSGHGSRDDENNNYLISINKSTASKDKEANKVAVSMVTEMMQNAGNKVNIIILDACRNNPSKGQNRGLASMSGGKEMLIAYAAAPGKLATLPRKGEGDNSFYTKHLLRFIEEPNLLIEDMLTKVQTAVEKDTDDQKPWYGSSLSKDFYFVPPKNIGE